MARETFENWIPVQLGDIALTKMDEVSVVDSEARVENMTSDTKDVPRSGDFAIAAVAKGASYGETSGTNDYVEMIARKVGGIARVAEEDIADSSVDILATKRGVAARNMAIFYDNACLASTGAANGTTRLYTSVYQAVRTNDSNAGYTADANYTASASAGYDELNAWLALYEEGEYFDEANTLIIASPLFKKVLRGVKDSTGNPILFDPAAGSSAPSILLGYRLRWSRGARLSDNNTYASTGNPLLIVCNKDLLIKGMARLSPQIANANPGFALQRAATGVGFTTDEALLKVAMRRGFVVGYPQGFAVFELEL